MSRTCKAGEFEISVWDGGHPIWFEILYRGEKLIGPLNSLELRDLIYAAETARREARSVARRMDPDRVDDY